MKFSRRNSRLLQQIFFFGLLAVGIFLALPALALAAPGDLDPTFGNGGKVATDFNFAGASDVVIQPDGKIIATGRNAGGVGSQIVLARYNPNGSLDTTFGTGGKVSTSVGQFNSASGIDIQADGRIVVAGSVCVYGPTCDFAVIRYNTDGSLDISFDGDGILIVDMGNDGSAHDLAIQTDGKIVVIGKSGIAGSRNYSFAAVRVNANGSLDTSFDGDGKVITSLGTFSDYGARAVALQSDGKIVAVGQSGTGTTYSSTVFALARYNPNGSLDPSFDGDGKVITDIRFGGEYASDVVIQPDGMIITVGNAPDNCVVARYRIDGSLDSTFGVGGVVLTDLKGYDFFSAVALQSNGKIVVGGGGFNGKQVIARYYASGFLDMTFGDNGILTTDFHKFEPENNLPGYGGVSGVAIQPNGRIVAAGGWGFDGEYAFFTVARYIGDAVAQTPKQFDFDGDGRSDISVFRPSGGSWYLSQSTAGFSATQFGLPTDKITPADFDGDGKTDIVIYRNGIWYLLRSTAGFTAVQFGLANDFPQPADFDGDGRAELAVYRGGNWFTLNLANNQVNTVQFGISKDKPVVGDYDGDGRADYAVYRDGTWYLLMSTQGFTSIQFGLSTDRVVPADYDVDGKTDTAVYRDGTWYLLGSQTGFTTFQFGLASDIPAPADYDGDGRTDAAVYRDGVWYLRQSTAGISTVQFGQASDLPVPSAYVP